MRRLTLAFALAAAMAAGQAAAQNAAADIRAVISEQIEAFKADDFARAFTYASPNIKRMFGDPARFGRMVREGYPMVWRPSEVRFSGLSEEGGRTIQSVLVKDAGGALFIVDYDMIAEGDGWRINGVRVRRTGAAGA